jgi:hypothetical protein
VTAGHEFQLLTDVPGMVEQFVTTAAAEQWGGESVVTALDLAALEVNLVRTALDQRLAEVELPCCPWPSVAATLTRPHVVSALQDSLVSSDGPKLYRLARLLGGPGRDVCIMLARAVESAA